jgi:hypothetical protein
MKFIKLNQGDDNYIYINLKNVIALKKSSYGTTIIMSDDNRFEVLDDIESIMDTIGLALISEGNIF